MDERVTKAGRRWWWPVALGGALGLAAIVTALAVGGDTVTSAQLAARWTARMSFLMFLPVYSASALARLFHAGWSKALLRERRYWGLGFALAHFIHLGALITFLRISGLPAKTVTLIGGGGGYVILAAMALTSNDAAMRALGVWWRRLHMVGIHWLWFVFAFSYSGRIADPGRMTTGLVFAPLAFAALGLRIAAAVKARRRKTGRAEIVVGRR